MLRSLVFVFVLVVPIRATGAQTAITQQTSVPASPPVAPAGSSAQQPQAVAPLPPVTPGGPPVGTAPAFIVQSDNGDNGIQLGALLHVDGPLRVRR